MHSKIAVTSLLFFNGLFLSLSFKFTCVSVLSMFFFSLHHLLAYLVFFLSTVFSFFCLICYRAVLEYMSIQFEKPNNYPF